MFSPDECFMYHKTENIHLKFKVLSMKVEKGNTVKSIQEAFNNTYPFLKIEFLRKATRKEIMDGSEIIHLPTKETNVDIDVNSKQTVKDLEVQFRTKANMNIKLFRKFCNVWIETSLTDDWTLEQQNNEGELLSSLNSDFVNQ